jgi:hypothetical protein
MDYMLWWDGSEKPLAERVSRAAQFYEAKYGRKPTTCLLPMSEETPGSVGGISCKHQPNVLDCHLMMGVA